MVRQFKHSLESDKQLVQRLLDTINMSQNCLTLRIEDSLEALDEVLDMDISRVALPEV